MHIPVMPAECLEALVTDPAGIYVDGTLGNGGHAAAILERLEPGGMLVAFDRDGEALDRVRGALRPGAGVRLELVHDNHVHMAARLDGLGIGTVNGLLLDLGVSSAQLDTAGRGFSFRHDGPLDMRMDQGQGLTAADLVASLGEADLAGLLLRYGEERAARRIARAIAEEREKGRIETTAHLAAIVERAKGGRKGGKIHPATKTFQALRMAVNDELAGLEAVLETMVGRVAAGGRIAVLTFHSLEDRLVKRFFNRHVPKEESLPQGGVRRVFAAPPVEWIWKKAPVATGAERAANPRSRSARLRAVQLGE